MTTMTDNTNETPNHSVDFSKTREVVIADLMIKATSAVAVVVIGVVGILIQQHLHDSQTQADDHAKQQRLSADLRDQEEQAYLPCFRGISEVDLALEEVSAQFGWPKYTEEEAYRENRLGTSLAYIADSLYFPAAKSSGGPEIMVRTAEANADKYNLEDGSDKKINLTVENAVRLLSELLRISPMLHQMNNPELTAEVERGSLVFKTSQNRIVDSIPLEERTVPAFELWLSKPINARHLYTDVDISGMADEIGKQVAEIARREIGAHPKLADKYVVIRSDVLRGREELLSVTK